MSEGHTDPLRATVFERSLLSARAGSSPALGQVLQACRAYLLVVAGRDVERDLRAKVAPSDLVQETCIEAQRHFDRFNGTTKGELIAWMRSILRHRMQKAQRRFRAAAKRRLAREIPLNGLSSIIGPAVRVPATADFPGQQLAEEEDAAKLAQALSRLPADYQQVIRLRNWELRTFASIGQEMRRSAEAARSLWSRAVQRLTEEIEQRDATGPR